MAVKVEPATAWSDVIEIKEEYWQKLERDSGFAFGHKFRTVVANILNDFYGDYCFYMMAIDPGDAKAQVAEILRLAEALSELLSKFDIFDHSNGKLSKRPLCQDRLTRMLEGADTPDEQFDRYIRILIKFRYIDRRCAIVSSLVGTSYQYNFDEYFPAHQYINSTRMLIGKLIASVSDALGRIDGAPGACGDRYVTKLLVDLHKAMVEATGNEKITKHYYDLVDMIKNIVAKKAERDFGKSESFQSSHLLRLDQEKIRQRLRDAKKLKVSKDTI